jgi:hypothetical protein
MASKRKYETIKLNTLKPWQVPTGHKEHRDTIMDNRPKRLRTRKAIDRSWRAEYDI